MFAAADGRRGISDKALANLEIMSYRYNNPFGGKESIDFDRATESNFKTRFDDLYQSMTGRNLKEKDEVVYATCRLCSPHQQTGFIDGIRLGLCLAQELKD